MASLASADEDKLFLGATSGSSATAPVSAIEAAARRSRKRSPVDPVLVGQNWDFAVNPAGDGERRLVVQADDEIEKDGWLSMDLATKICLRE